MHITSIFYKKQKTLPVSDTNGKEFLELLNRSEHSNNTKPSQFNMLLPNVISLPNLKSKTVKNSSVAHLMKTLESKDGQLQMETQQTPSGKLRKSKSFNFLSKYIKKSKPVKISNPYCESTSNESFGDLILQYEEMMIPVEQKIFLKEVFDKNLQYNLKLLHTQLKNDIDELNTDMVDNENIKFSDVPHSTEIILDYGDTQTSRDVIVQTQQETDYDPKNQSNYSLVNHYGVNAYTNENNHKMDTNPEYESKRLSINSKTSNILDDISSIVLDPMAKPINSQEKEPLISDIFGQSLETLIEETDADSYRLSAQRLSMPMNKNVVPEVLSQCQNNQESGKLEAKILRNRKYMVTPVNESLSLSDFNLVGTPNTSELQNLETVTFEEALSHSTSKNNSSAQLSSEFNDKTGISGSRFETIKDVKYEQIRNYSHVNIISPQPVPVNDSTRIQELKKRLATLLKPTDNLNIESASNPIATLSKDEVYRNEMLSLIETHSTMVNKKQDEINHLKELLLKERERNNLLSSPQYKEHSLPSTRFSHTKSSPLINEMSLPLSPDSETRKIRNQFIPINITLTQESKPHNYIPVSKMDGSVLLPPFDMVSSTSNIKDSVPVTSKPEHGLKPFHKFKVTSPRMADPMNYGTAISEEIGADDNRLTGLGISITNPRASIISEDSSVYFSAQEWSFDESDSLSEHNQVNNSLEINNQQNLHDFCSGIAEDTLFRQRNERRELSQSTTVSSIMSKIHCRSNDSIMNTSLTSCITTPDSIEHKFDKR